MNRNSSNDELPLVVRRCDSPHDPKTTIARTAADSPAYASFHRGAASDQSDRPRQSHRSNPTPHDAHGSARRSESVLADQSPVLPPNHHRQKPNHVRKKRQQPFRNLRRLDRVITQRHIRILSVDDPHLPGVSPRASASMRTASLYERTMYCPCSTWIRSRLSRRRQSMRTSVSTSSFSAGRGRAQTGRSFPGGSRRDGSATAAARCGDRARASIAEL